MPRRIIFAAVLLLLVIGCTRQELPQGNIFPVGNHYDRAMQLCEGNHYAEAELILKEGELAAEASDNKLELQKCQETRYLVARILNATTQQRDFELLHDQEKAKTMGQFITLAKELRINIPEDMSLLNMLKTEPAFCRPFIPADIDSVMPASPAEKAGIRKAVQQHHRPQCPDHRAGPAAHRNVVL